MSIRLRETVSVNDIFADAPSRGKTKVCSECFLGSESRQGNLKKFRNSLGSYKLSPGDTSSRENHVFFIRSLSKKGKSLCLGEKRPPPPPPVKIHIYLVCVPLLVSHLMTVKSVDDFSKYNHFPP